MLDRDGYRPNVGIILVNDRNEVFWGKRVREHSWQFPQGGIKRGESPEHAMFRELHEEVGLHPDHVRIIARTRDWLRYDVPEHWVRREWRGHYRGQKQIWFLLRLTGRDTDIDLRASTHPEFDAWRWHPYWIPLETVIEFKREVYRMALEELARHLGGDPGDPSRYLRRRVRHRHHRAGGAPDADAASPPDVATGDASRAAEVADDAVRPAVTADVARPAVTADVAGAPALASGIATAPAADGPEPVQ